MVMPTALLMAMAFLFLPAVLAAMTGMYDYKGRKCYQVLVGRDSPCETCTGSCLNTETYHVREKRNGYLQRHFMLKEKLIYWQNRLAGLTVAIDLTEKEIMSQNVQEKLEFESNIVACTKMLLEETDIHKAINGMLRSIGTFYMADRAYLFQLQSNRQFWDNTYEWCAEGDRVLKQMADVLLSTFRRKDLIGRFGGDEFLIFLKNTTDRAVIDRRMKEMNSALLSMNRHGCTCSIGITFVNREDFHYETCLKHADIALYQSKKRGKNTHSYYGEL